MHSEWDHLANWVTMIWQPCDLYAPQGVEMGGGGSSSQRNDTVNGLSWGGTCNCRKHL